MAVFTLTDGADVFPAGQDTSGDDQIQGLGGNDVLDGGAGADRFDGGEGTDTVSYASASAGIFVNPQSRVPRNDGTGDTFISIERFVLSAFNDFFWADASLNAGFEADGGAGDDRIYAAIGADTLSGGDGNDDIRGKDGADILHGGAGNDLLDGGAGKDRLFGGDGDDLLQGGTNNDMVDGGDGFDTMILYGDPGQYELSLNADGSVRLLHLSWEAEDGGYTVFTGAVDTIVNVERLRYYDGTIFDLAAWIAANSAPAGVNVITGTDQDDSLAGTTAADAIYGRDGADAISGGDGDDLLVGGAGADAFDGGDGIDTVSYRAARSAVEVNVPPPFFPVFGPYDPPPPEEPTGPPPSEEKTDEGAGDSFVSIERVELSAFDDIIYWAYEAGVTVLGHEGSDLIGGNAGIDTLDGGGDDDVLLGKESDDTLLGGLGADKLFGGDGDDVLDGGLGRDSIDGGLGYDTVVFGERSTGVVLGYSTVSHEDDIYYSIEAFRLTDFDDRIRLSISRGDQTDYGVSDVFAGAGNDEIDGGSISGELHGEDGDDTITAAHWGSFVDGGAGDDTIYSAWGGDTIAGGEGTDIVHYGYPRDEYVVTREGDTVVVAHAGSGWVDRLTGVETLTFPDRVFTDRLEIDTATIRDALAPLRVFSAKADTFRITTGENMLFGLAGNDNLEGGAEDDMVSGGEGDDMLYGHGGNDSLYGGPGDDHLDGGAGDDRMAGGDGNDTYVVDSAGDTVVELHGQGLDTVRTGLGSRSAGTVYVIPDFVESLVGTSTSGQAVRGNALDNSLTLGNGADLVLLDDGGDDAVKAGGGNDFIYYGASWTAFDRTFGGDGTDTIGLMGNYSLVLGSASLVQVERLALYSTAATGNLASYAIRTIDQNVASGDHLLVTGASLVAGEILMFNGSAETDASFTLIGGGGEDILAGGARNDRLSGGAGYDSLFGGGGDDVLTGGLDGDLLNGGGGSDRLVYASAAESSGIGFDTIKEFNHRVDRIDLPGTVSGWTGEVEGRLAAGSFDADIAAATDGALQANSAVLFRTTSGDFAGRLFAIVDANGDGAYSAGVDFVFEFINLPVPLTPASAIFV
jgi:Ca2+-binding RTX toxin-like protein